MTEREEIDALAHGVASSAQGLLERVMKSGAFSSDALEEISDAASAIKAAERIMRHRETLQLIQAAE